MISAGGFGARGFAGSQSGDRGFFIGPGAREARDDLLEIGLKAGGGFLGQVAVASEPCLCSIRTVSRCPPAPRRRWPSASGFRGLRFDTAQRALSLAEGRKIVAARTLASLDGAPSTDALAPQMSGGIIAGGDSRSTRITETELAAKNRRADFPASPRVARSRRPRPSSTGTVREGSAEQVLPFLAQSIGHDHE